MISSGRREKVKQKKRRRRMVKNERRRQMGCQRSRLKGVQVLICQYLAHWPVFRTRSRSSASSDNDDIISNRCD